MLVMYLLATLLLSSVHRLSAEYDAIGHSHPRMEHRENDKAVWVKATNRPEDAAGGINTDSYDRQNVTSGGSDGQGNTELDHDFDDGKEPQEKSARITIRAKRTKPETYRGFTNRIFEMSKDNITTAHSANLSTDLCKFPTHLKESEVDCTTYPSKVVCIQTCMFGYTLSGKDGIRRRMKCSREENRWRPVAEFEHCQPFVDCGVTIGPGGSYLCRKNYMHKGNDCDIACSAYGDNDAVPAARYECDINGNWTPPLPFCVRAGSGLKLVPAPHGSKHIS